MLSFSIWNCAWLAPLALFLDLLLGDPPLPWPHPVCVIGRVLNFFEKFVTGTQKPVLEKLAGFAVLCLVTGSSFGIIHLLVSLPYAGVIFAIYFAWAGLAMGCLLSTGKKVGKMIESGDPETGRRGVSWLVSRDVSRLDQPMLRKTLADTLGENFTDAFMAPFFWLLFTGPAGLWAYRAVSTMDSMWGYLTPKWRNAGWAGARGDDILAFVPARLSPFALLAAERLLPQKLKIWHGDWPGLKQIRKDAQGMTSPNSGWSMAACAWLCGGRMAGPSVYFGEVVPKAWLGPEHGHLWHDSNLDALCRLLLYGAILGGIILWLGALAIRAIIFP